MSQLSPTSITNGCVGQNIPIGNKSHFKVIEARDSGPVWNKGFLNSGQTATLQKQL